jgi:hypothetical protein
MGAFRISPIRLGMSVCRSVSPRVSTPPPHWTEFRHNMALDGFIKMCRENSGLVNRTKISRHLHEDLTSLVLLTETFEAQQ